MFSAYLAVGDRKDILRKFNQLIDKANRRATGRKHEDDDQAVADQASAEATWRAGYDPLKRDLVFLTDSPKTRVKQVGFSATSSA
jgi:hypothetical protein